MRDMLLVVDVQPSFTPPDWLVTGIRALAKRMPSVATVERHDESRTPFERQLGWHPARDDESLIALEQRPHVCRGLRQRRLQALLEVGAEFGEAAVLAAVAR